MQLDCIKRQASNGRRIRVLRAQELCKSYGAARVVEGVTFEVAAGEVFCLLGPNGAGKTTSLNMFLGFVQPTSGAAFVAGERVVDDPVGARGRVAYVPEQVRLFPQLSGYENLAYLLGLSRARVPRRDTLCELLEDVGLAQQAIHRPASEYSKGMRQRVVLALSRAREARALLLDEPTSGLDPKAVHELCAAIEAESQRGAATLMVTHDLSAVASVAHRVGIMKAGRLVAVEPVMGLPEADIAALYRDHFESAGPRPARAHGP